MPNRFAHRIDSLPPARCYRVLVLDRPDVLRAFPLARLAVGHLTLATWQRFARAMGVLPTHRKTAAPKKGLLAVEDQRGLIQALCSFAVHPDLRAGRRLDIENFVAVDLIDNAGPSAVLVKAIEALARSLDCADLAIYPPPAARSQGAALFLAGLRGAAYVRPQNRIAGTRGRARASSAK
jgi:hypothetical protein